MTTLGERVGGPKRVVGGPFGSKLTSADYTVKGVPVIRGSNMEQNGRWIGGEFAFVSTEKAASDLRSNIARRGDIIVTQRGTMGQVSIVPDDAVSDQFVISQSQMAISVDATCASRDFVYYYLRSPQFAEYLTQSIIQTGVPHINLGILRQAPVEWPQADVQEVIAGQLKILDDKIELNRRMNETLEAMAQAIFRDWFVDFGPVRRKLAGETEPVAIMGGLTPDSVRAAELAMLFPARIDVDGLPEGWAAGAAGDLIEFNPKEPLKRGVPAPYSDMSSLPTVGSSADLPIMREFGSGTRFRNGDALLARITPCLENGKTALVDFLTEESPVGWGSTEFIVHRARPGTPQPLPYLLCRNDDYRSYAIQSMTGTSGRQRAQAESLEAWPMAIPTGPVLKALGDFVDAFFARISASSRENRSLAETRDYLLPRLMSGQVRLNPSNTGSAAA